MCDRGHCCLGKDLGLFICTTLPCAPHPASAFACKDKYSSPNKNTIIGQNEEEQKNLIKYINTVITFLKTLISLMTELYLPATNPHHHPPPPHLSINYIYAGDIWLPLTGFFINIEIDELTRLNR